MGARGARLRPIARISAPVAADGRHCEFECDIEIRTRGNFRPRNCRRGTFGLAGVQCKDLAIADPQIDQRFDQQCSMRPVLLHSGVTYQSHACRPWCQPRRAGSASMSGRRRHVRTVASLLKFIIHRSAASNRQTQTAARSQPWLQRWAGLTNEKRAT